MRAYLQVSTRASPTTNVCVTVLCDVIWGLWAKRAPLMCARRPSGASAPPAATQGGPADFRLSLPGRGDRPAGNGGTRTGPEGCLPRVRGLSALQAPGQDNSPSSLPQGSRVRSPHGQPWPGHRPCRVLLTSRASGRREAVESQSTELSLRSHVTCPAGREAIRSKMGASLAETT